MSETTLVRVVGGGKCKVHLATCRYAINKNTFPWHWAEGRPVAEVFAATWNVPCRVCKPDAFLAERENGGAS